MGADISVVISVFNESENAEDLCRALDEYAAGKAFGLELVFVDDGSADDTTDIIGRYPFRNARARLVVLSKNYGSHAALRAGISVAEGEYTMLFSGDLQEPVELIEKLYNAIRANKGYDVVYVQRGDPGVRGSSSVFSRLYARLIKRYAVKNFPLGGVNNFMLSRKVRQELARRPETNSSLFLQVIDMGYRHTLINCDYLERSKGQSKWTLGKKIKLFIDSFVAFSFVPIRAISLLGVALSVVGLLYALYIVIMKLTNFYSFEAGFPTLVSALLLGFGITNISLGIVSEYLWRTFDAARGRPAFIIDEVVDITPPHSIGGTL